MEWLDRFKHLFGFHKYYRIMRLGDYSHLLGCKFCNKKFAINTYSKVLLAWDLELEDLHRKMGHFNINKFNCNKDE